MSWLRSHSYASASAGAALLILIGALIVNSRTGTAPINSQTVAWGGAGTLVSAAAPPSPASSAAAPSGTTIMQQVENTAPYHYIPTDVSVPVPGSDNSPSNSFDYNAFITALEQENSQGNAASSSASTDSGSANAYAYVPSSLVSTTSSAATRTALQQSLYEYGNAVGSSIQSFEQEHPTMAQVLTDQAQDRTDPQKNAALAALAAGLSDLGMSIASMDNVPPEAASAHLALAKSYEDLGAKLALVPQAQGDSAFVSAIEAYDGSVAVFVKNYVALAELFSSYGVQFSQSDPGSVFTFSNASS